MTPVRKTTRKASETVKAEPKKTVAAVKAEEPKKAPATVKAAEPEKKVSAPAKKTVEKKAEFVKPVEKKVVETKKAEEGKKAAAPVATVTVEYSGRQYSAKAVVEQAINVYRDTHKGEEIKTVDVYLQPEKNVAYYVINGVGSDDFRIDL